MELAFGARLPGHTHLQLHELNPASTRITELPVGAPQQWPGTIPRCSPGLATPLRTNLRVPASPTRIHACPSTEVPTPSDYVIYNLGAHSDLPLLYGPSSGASPSTRIRIPNKGSDKARRTRIRLTSPWATLWAPVSPTRNLQTETNRAGPRRIRYCQTRRSPALAGPLRTKYGFAR